MEQFINYTIRLINEDDKDYLKYKAKSEHLSMTELLFMFISNDISYYKTHDIDAKDEIHQYISFSKTTIPTSLRITKTQHDLLFRRAAFHKLSVSKYISMLIYKERANDISFK